MGASGRLMYRTTRTTRTALLEYVAVAVSFSGIHEALSVSSVANRIGPRRGEARSKSKTSALRTRLIMGNPTLHGVWNDFPTVFQTLTRFRMKLFVVHEIGENSTDVGRMGPSRRDSWRCDKD